MSNTTTKSAKEKADKKIRNGQNGASVAPEVVEEAVATSAQSAQTPPTPGLTIEVLPPEIQAVLKGFKSQLSSAPVEIRDLVATYLFDRPAAVAPPATTATTETDPGTQVTPETVTEPVAPSVSEPNAQTSGSDLATPVVRKFQNRDVPAGFQRLPPLLMYSAQANKYAPMQALAIDVLQWGSRPVIVVLCKEPVFVLGASGEIVLAPPKTPFAIPAESDLGNFVRPLIEDPAGAYEIFFSPSSIVRDDSGLQIVRYDPIGIGARVPKATVVR